MTVKILDMPIKEFTPDEALKHCFEFIKPSLMNDKDLYNKFREYRRRYNNDPDSLGAGARDAILNFFGFEMVYKKDMPKKEKKK